MSPGDVARGAFRLAVAIGLTAYLVFWYADPRAIADAMAGAQWIFVIAAIALVLVDRILMAWRWIALLEDTPGAPRPPVRRLVRIFLVSTFLGTFLPVSVGSDALRAWSLARERVPGAHAAASVVMDRLLGVVALVTLAAAGLAWGRSLMPEPALRAALAVAVAGCAAGLAVVYSGSLAGLLSRLTARVPGFAGRVAARTLDAVRAYAPRHGVVTRVFAASLAVNVLRVLQAWLLGVALGLQLPLVVYFAFVPMIVLLMLLPVTIFGLGVAQAGFDWFFAHAGVPSHQALALSFLFIGLGVLGNLPGAALYVAGSRSRERSALGILLVLVMLMPGALACGSSPTGPAPITQPPPPPPPPPPPSPAPRLSKLQFLAFGDSLTEGVVTPSALGPLLLTPGRAESYPFKLQQLLRARYSEQQPIVLNAGRAGEQAGQALSRLQAVLEEAPSTDVVLLLEGINDLNAFGEFHIPATVDAMKALMREVKRRGMVPLVATMIPLNPDGRRAAAAALVPDYNRDLVRTAQVEGVQVVDLFAQFDVALQGPDGLHPGEAGYARMAEIFADAIRSAFELPSPAASRTR